MNRKKPTTVQIADLFEIKSNTVTEHLKSIYAEGELGESSTARSFRVVRQEGSRSVERDINH